MQGEREGVGEGKGREGEGKGGRREEGGEGEEGTFSHNIIITCNYAVINICVGEHATLIASFPNDTFQTENKTSFELWHTFDHARVGPLLGMQWNLNSTVAYHYITNMRMYITHNPN